MAFHRQRVGVNLMLFPDPTVDSGVRAYPEFCTTEV
jgi:hypothetical protein